MNTLKLIPANPENPGYLMPCTHPTHGECLIHVGDGDPQSIERAMARCGTVPMIVDNPGVDSIVIGHAGRHLTAA